MKQRINLGAYGWRHEHWQGSFYPEDLPMKKGDDWRLGYYSNEFDAVLIPVDYWQALDQSSAVAEDWLESVHPNFQFLVECHPDMFDGISLADLTEALLVLAPQCAGLVFLDDIAQSPSGAIKPFIKLADLLDVEIIVDLTVCSETLKVWKTEGAGSQRRQSPSGFAFIKDDLSDLRLARANIEQFASQIKNDLISADAVLIVYHPQLPAAQLNSLRTVLDIMGY